MNPVASRVRLCRFATLLLNCHRKVSSTLIEGEQIKIDLFGAGLRYTVRQSWVCLEAGVPDEFTVFCAVRVAGTI